MIRGFLAERDPPQLRDRLYSIGRLFTICFFDAIENPHGFSAACEVLTRANVG
jgi:hypothetical protein